jgi:predicted transcriptional regulator
MGNEQIIELLANENSRAIVSLTSIKECSAIQLSQELDIPLATVYRNLKLLEADGLIQHVKTIINLQGNEEKYFRCAISEVAVRIHEGVLSVEVKKEECNYKVIRLWRRLAHPKFKDLSNIK